MRPEDFNADAARKVMELWAKHLGFWDEDRLYLRSPELLSSRIQDPKVLFIGFEDRIGSRYSDDSKLTACCHEDSGLEVMCYVQEHSGKQEAIMAEESFNRAVSEFLQK